MPYQKTKWGGGGWEMVRGSDMENVEGALDVGYHAVTVANCAQHMMIYEAESAFWPFFEARLDVVQDFGPNGYHFYTSLGAAQDLEDWDTTPEGVGVVRAYVFNGVDEYLIALDQDFFTVEAGNEFSVGCWVYPNVAVDNCFLSKWDATNAAEKREWYFLTDNTGYLTFAIYDETNNAEIGREYQTALETDGWHFIMARYDGGTDAANIDIFYDGLEVDDATVIDDAGFASMVNQTTPVRCGSFEAADGSESYLYDGKMAMPFFTLKELSDVEIWNLYQLGRAALNLDLIAGMPD